MSEWLSPKQFEESDGAGDWRVLGDGACAFFRTGSFGESARFVGAMGTLPGAEDHVPSVDLRHDGVTVRLVTAMDDNFGTTTQDLEMARQISRLAAEHRLAADPSAMQSVLIVPGAADVAEVMPFWQAVLGYVPRADSPAEDLVDPTDRGPAFWFEEMKEPRPGGGGAIHVAVWVPSEHGPARVAAALAAGGRLVRDDYAPAWWTLADAAGNEADISTASGRG